MEVASIPIFQSEIVPGPVRGIAAGSYQMAIVRTNLLDDATKADISGARRTGHQHHLPRDKRPKWECRVANPLRSVLRHPNHRDVMRESPLSPVLAALILQIFLIPESPRWLLSKGRVDEARRALTRIRVDPSPPAIEDEMQNIMLSLQAERDKGTYADLFRGTNLRRTAIVWTLFFFLQSTGEAFASRYSTIYVRHESLWLFVFTTR